MKVENIIAEIHNHLENIHTGCFPGMDKPVLLISEEYPGVWLEQVYDSVFYARLDKTKLPLAENTIRLFLSYQKEDGQLPCYIWDARRVCVPEDELVGYSQIQECVSFARLCYETYEMNRDLDFLREVYRACGAWAEWLFRNRTTTHRGLIEMFVGYDTGHDNSGRLEGLSCHGNYLVNGVLQNASVLPPNDEVAPILAVDINCIYFGTPSALSEMARALSLEDEAEAYLSRAKNIKENIFRYLYCAEDCFFYDVDKNGNMRKYLSSTILHLFLEGVLDPEDDKALIDEICRRHIFNPNEFYTPYPFPSMAISDPSTVGHPTFNCWGYYTQGLIAMRTTRWMERYGFTKQFDSLCKTWVDVWTRLFDTVKLAQELDPITGEPTACSEWYSATMLFYLYSAKRLGYNIKKGEACPSDK